MKRVMLCIMLAGIVLAASGCKKTAEEQISGVYELVEPEPAYPEEMELRKDGTLISRSVSKYRMEVDRGKQLMIREELGKERDSSSQQFWNIIKKDGKYQFIPDVDRSTVTPSKFTLTFKSGKDGLSDIELFDGVYYAEGKEKTSFTFHKDGSTTWELKRHKYKADQEHITCIEEDGSKTYSYQLSEDGKELHIKRKDQLIACYKKRTKALEEPLITEDTKGEDFIEKSLVTEDAKGEDFIEESEREPEFGPFPLSADTETFLFGKWKVKKLLGFCNSWNDASEYPKGQDIIGDEIVMQSDVFSSLGLKKYPVYQYKYSNPYYYIDGSYHDTLSFYRVYKLKIPGLKDNDTVQDILVSSKPHEYPSTVTFFCINNKRLILSLEATIFELEKIKDSINTQSITNN